MGQKPEASYRVFSGPKNKDRLPNCPFPMSLCVTYDLELACDQMQFNRGSNTKSGKFAEENHTYLRENIACCKDLTWKPGKGRRHAEKCISSGRNPYRPQLCNDIARGLPTALTLACEQAD